MYGQNLVNFLHKKSINFTVSSKECVCNYISEPMAIVSAVKIIGKKQPKKEKNMNLSVRLKKKKEMWMLPFYICPYIC